MLDSIVHCMPCDFTDGQSHPILHGITVIKTTVSHNLLELCWSLVPMKNQWSPILINDAVQASSQ